MTTFGFSAFLKLLSLNSRPQRREVRQRFLPREKGYDFHRSLRLRTTRLLVDRENLEALVGEAATFGNPAERRSLEAGLRQLNAWRLDNPGEVTPVDSSIYSSPRGRFKVNYVPDFGYMVNGNLVAIHVWNTGTVDLVPRRVYAALNLVKFSCDHEYAVDDVAVLSLPENRLYRLSDVPDQTRSARILAAELDALFEDVRQEVFGPDRPIDGPSDQPQG